MWASYCCAYYNDQWSAEDTKELHKWAGSTTCWSGVVRLMWNWKLKCWYTIGIHGIGCIESSQHQPLNLYREDGTPREGERGGERQTEPIAIESFFFRIYTGSALFHCFDQGSILEITRHEQQVNECLTTWTSVRKIRANMLLTFVIMTQIIRSNIKTYL